MAEYADLILKNANIITCDPEMPQAEAVAIRGNRIWLVGDSSEVLSAGDRSTRTVDCGGRTLVPGFIDAHCHFFSFVRKFFSLDLSPAAVRSIADIQESIRRKVSHTQRGTWISGTDYNEFYLAEKRHPTRRDLDAAAPDHPVILIHRSMHACVLNSPALRIIGITNETEEPPAGMIDRDLDTGEPNGILFEMLGYVQERLQSPIPESEMDRAVGQASQQYLSVGITSFGEATVSNDLDQWNAFSRLKEAGKITSRINMMPGSAFMKEFEEAGLVTGAGDDGLRIGNLKIILSEATGQIRPSQEELNRMVRKAVEAGFPAAIHAVERSTVEAAINALETAQREIMHPHLTSPIKGEELVIRRHRIEHCSECPPDLRQRLAKLRTVIVSQPPFLYYSGERYLSQVSPETQKWLYPFKSWLDNGLVVAGSSDSPVVSNNPLSGIFAAVTRQAESGQTVLAEESVSVRQALEMYTVNAAYASGEEHIKGSITPGKLADIIMLSDNLLISPAEQIEDISVEMTIVDGKIVWERESL